MDHRSFRIAVVAGVTLAALASFAVAAPPQTPISDTSGLSGRQLYDQVGCAACHGYRGQGGSAGPRLAGKSYTAEGFALQLRHPSQEMPPYTDAVISEAQAKAILLHVQSFGEPSAK